jgi:uncharacterized membrane-anchored protein YitT (DUF2179 family)
VSDPLADGAASPHLAPRSRHTLLEDGMAIVTAAGFVSLGTSLLGKAGLLTGGTAGIALLLARLTPFTFGQLFLALNVPFFWLGVRRLGWRFTLKTFAAIGLVAAASDHLAAVLAVERVAPGYAAVMGGFLIGMGLLILFRHRASLGGINILSLWLQERRGIRAGAFQLAVDLAVLGASFLVVDPLTIGLSVLGAIALNVVLAVNHRPGRYLGT